MKMVELHNSDMSDFKANAMAIASAFQAANDDDTMTVMNAMANNQSQTTTTDPLMFYIVPASWFLKAWPVLAARSPDGIQEGWRELIGRIQNAELMNVEREVSSSSDDDEGDDNANTLTAAERQKKRFEQLHLRMATKKSSATTTMSTMKKGMVHKVDYFFLGPSSWMLVKEKFDFDGYELARSCVSASLNTLAIKLHAEESEDNKALLIDIPASGRFAYEKVIPKEEPSKSDIVPQEVEGTPDESLKLEPGGVTGAQTTTVTNTSEEEEQPILLLPPSTTQYDIFPSDDNMEVDSNKGSNISAVATPSFAGRKRLASGLGNLGNTCFMNSTLQCLAHTEPLRRYFLSGDYEADLNRDNPLGTGGELASQFASLISEMWGIATKRRNVLGAAETSSYSHSSSSAVYPRSFKYCLGKHAEQFMGYDQHDSQELATYLLDALHEDTNRVTKKPYVEKPEQGEDEPDELASNKAWGLHLQREDSRVLENFMGQVKSRLECCEPDCNRVSTTFDPFMYLSVPIPGASDRTLKLTFIPLDPNQKMKNLQLTISKTATMSKLMEKMNEELIRLGICNEPIPTHDLCPVDVWSHEVFSWYSDDSEIDRIRDSDTTYIFQLRPLSEVQEVGKNDEESDNFDNKFGESRTKHRYQLDLGTMTKLNLNDEWMKELEKYVHQPTLLYSMFNPNRGTIDERMQFHKKMENFIDVCHKEITEEEPSGLKRTREESDADSKSETPSEEAIQGLQDRCDASKTFENVKTRQDVAVLEFIANKIRQFILRLVHEKKNKFKDGIMIQIIMRRPQNGTHSSTKDSTFAPPLVLRIAPNMTVYGLREELATRFSRSLSLTPMNDTPGSGESSAEGGDKGNRKPVDETFGSPELLIMRQIPLTFERKSTYSNKSSLGSNKKLGMLEKAGNQTQEESRQAVLAVSSDESEQALLLDIVGHKGTVNMDWPTELCNRSFDLNEYETADDASTRAPSPEAQKVTTVLDCIEKYCQKEQLEETEMWYCNRCKKHVRAWKQFHLYRAPPILIVHLKRFHYSATTHRRDKITAFIDFELEGLDLSELFTHYSEEEKPIYDCYAVSNHYGGLGGGHYTAYTLSDDGTWCHYDDSRVTNSIDVKEVVSEAAYVLYYRRRDVPVGEDFIENSVPSSPMVCEEEDAPMMQGRGSSEVSSNNTAQAGDDDRNDDLTMDEVDEGSGGTCSSRVASLDGDTANEPPGDIVTFGTDVDFPLQ